MKFINFLLTCIHIGVIICFFIILSNLLSKRKSNTYNPPKPPVNPPKPPVASFFGFNNLRHRNDFLYYYNVLGIYDDDHHHE